MKFICRFVEYSQDDLPPPPADSEIADPNDAHDEACERAAASEPSADEESWLK